MRPWAVSALVGIAVALALGPQPASGAQGSASVSVTLDREAVSVAAGERFSFTSTLRNLSDQSLTGLVAHLNVAGLSPDIYVDPEDWSGERTQYLRPLGPQTLTRLGWNMQAVGAGRLVVYIAVLQPERSEEIVASDFFTLEVTQRRELSGGSVLPVSLTVPAVLAGLLGLTARRRRRLR